MFPPRELILDLDLTLRKEATVIPVMCGRQCHLAWTIFAGKPLYFPISWFALPLSQLSSSPPFAYEFPSILVHLRVLLQEKNQTNDGAGRKENTNEKCLTKQLIGKERRGVKREKIVFIKKKEKYR